MQAYVPGADGPEICVPPSVVHNQIIAPQSAPLLENDNAAVCHVELAGFIPRLASRCYLVIVAAHHRDAETGAGAA